MRRAATPSGFSLHAAAAHARSCRLWQLWNMVSAQSIRAALDLAAIVAACCCRDRALSPSGGIPHQDRTAMTLALRRVKLLATVPGESSRPGKCGRQFAVMRLCALHAAVSPAQPVSYGGRGRGTTFFGPVNSYGCKGHMRSTAGGRRQPSSWSRAVPGQLQQTQLSSWSAVAATDTADYCQRPRCSAANASN
jgi:hypothetical protein